MKWCSLLIRPPLEPKQKRATKGLVFVLGDFRVRHSPRDSGAHRDEPTHQWKPTEERPHIHSRLAIDQSKSYDSDMLRIFSIFRPIVALGLHLAFSSTFANGTTSACPANALIPESLVNPVGIKSYLSSNSLKIKTIDDFICCLPKSYRENYVIAHSSKAAQNSTFDSPRILLFNPVREHPIRDLMDKGQRWRKPLQSVLSINGGDPSLNQANSIEMLYNNTRLGEVELFDIENHHQNFRMSSKNPEVCMGCHAQGVTPGIGGPKTIFDPPFSWPRFIKGISPCTEAEKELTAALETASQKHFQTNTRFRCLDPKPDSVSPFQTDGVRPSFMLSDLDDSLADLNDRRVAKIIRSSPDYEKYKYAILGSLICGRNFQASNWLPTSVIATHNSENYLSSEVKKSTDLKATLDVAIKRFTAEEAQLAKRQKEAAKKILAGEQPEIEFSTRPTACSGDKRESLEFNLRELVKNLNGPALLDKYKVDTFLHSFRTSSANSALRYLFEARGLSTEDWSMDPVSGRYSRGHDQLAHHLVMNEPSSSPLKKMEARLRAANLLDHSLLRIKKSPNEDDRKSLCQELQRHSMTAFAGTTTRPHDPQPSKTAK